MPEYLYSYLICPLNFTQSINSEYSLEGLMLKLKLQYFGHLMWRVDSLEKKLILGKTEGRRRRGRQKRRWLDGITNLWIWVWTYSRRQWRTFKTGMLHAVHGVTKSHTQLSDWTTTWFGNMYNFVQIKNNLDKEKKEGGKRKDEAEEEKKKQRSINQN